MPWRHRYSKHWKWPKSVLNTTTPSSFPNAIQSSIPHCTHMHSHWSRDKEDEANWNRARVTSTFSSVVTCTWFIPSLWYAHPLVMLKKKSSQKQVNAETRIYSNKGFVLIRSIVHVSDSIVFHQSSQFANGASWWHQKSHLVSSTPTTSPKMQCNYLASLLNMCTWGRESRMKGIERKFILSHH